MKFRPLYSVVMSIYRGDDLNQIRSAIESILNQTYKPNQFVIVVDGPVLKDIAITLEEYKKKEDIELYFLENNLGSGLARNFAVKKCRNELIGIMDADDISLPNRFQIQVAEMFKSNVDVIGGWISEFDIDSQVSENLRIRMVPREHTEIFRYGQLRNPMNHVTLLFKKKVFMSIGGYKKIAFYEDYDLIVRLMMQGAKFLNVQKILVQVRCGHGMFSRRGGAKNILAEISFFCGIYIVGYLTIGNLILNLMLRIPVRLVPSGVRKYIYIKFLRGKEIYE